MRIAAVFAAGLWCCALASDTITTGSLVDEMTDLHRLTRYPSPAYKTVQFSSYDRSSSMPGGKGWYANSDGFGEEPIPNFEEVIKPAAGNAPGEYLVCNVKGPGAIVRTWTAQIRGSLRVYLDHAKTPLYDGPAEKFLLRPYDTFLDGTGLTPESLDGAFYQRNAAYAPIPFSKQCRIVWTGNPKEIHFYEVQMRLYEQGAKVKTFDARGLAAHAERIRAAAALLRSPDANWPYRATRGPAAISAALAPGASVEALRLDGPGAIERLELKVDAADIDAALRQTVLNIHFDGAPWGQVQSPVGDFFGAGPGVNPYTSAPFTVASDGAMTCRFVMPYKESVRIVLQNRGAQPVTVSGAAQSTEYAWDDAASMHFRARWRTDHGLVNSDAEVAGVQDLPFLFARGTGVYVGTAIMLLNPNNIPTSWGNWWGEGDEKIFVDDDTHPSIFGTGSEDYFNYAWSMPDIFYYPYCGQPRNDGPANRGNVVNFRWHVLDPLPFRKNIAFTMELFGHERTPGISYARVGYHYARPGLTDDSTPLTDGDVRVPQLPNTWEPEARFGTERFVFRACEDVADATETAAVFEKDGLWQGGRVLVWTPQAAGEQKRFALAVPEGGEHTLMIACMLKPGAGAFRADVDGAALKLEGKDRVALDVPANVQSRVFGGQFTVTAAGAHTLTLTALEGGRPIGLDFFGLQRR